MFRPIHGHHQVDCLKFPLCNKFHYVTELWCGDLSISLCYGVSIGSIAEERWMETKTKTRTMRMTFLKIQNLFLGGNNIRGGIYPPSATPPPHQTYAYRRRRFGIWITRSFYRPGSLRIVVGSTCLTWVWKRLMIFSRNPIRNEAVLKRPERRLEDNFELI